MKHSGAAISSRFIPPKLTEKFFMLLTISLGSLLSISRSIASISANRLNKTALKFHGGVFTTDKFNGNLKDILNKK